MGITELRKGLSRWLEIVQEQRTDICIERYGTVVAWLVPNTTLDKSIMYERERFVGRELRAALEAMVESSDALAHAAPNALAGAANAMELHRAAVKAREMASVALARTT